VKRREFIAGLGGFMAWPIALRAQQRPLPVVGYLSPGTPEQNSDYVSAFRRGLNETGLVEGRDVTIEYRFSGDPRNLAEYAEELVNLRPDVIFAYGPAARAVQQRTSVIPIVFVGLADPNSNGLVRNIARPEGNITGFANSYGSLGGRWLELFKEAIPRLTRIGNIFLVSELSVETRATIAAAAAQLGVTIIRMPVRNAVEIEDAVKAFAGEPDRGLLVTGAINALNALPISEAIDRLALYYHLPLMRGGGSDIGREGVLLSHGPDIRDLVRRASSYVDRILRGAKLSELPVQYPSKLELVVNLKTAKAIGVTIPETFLARADEVIE
jgi:putative tryptophan/tyrosine transport system substrate-binding protein